MKIKIPFLDEKKHKRAKYDYAVSTFSRRGIFREKNHKNNFPACAFSHSGFKKKVFLRKCSIDIKKIVRKKKGNIGYCYDRLVKSYASAAGRLDLTIKIQDTGNKVTIAKGSIKNKDFHRCIKRKVKKWKFPKNCVNVTFKKTYILTTDD